jgi:O-6-methylguanine DNA methyltransferase
MPDFDRKVLDLVSKIPKGKITTYGELAKALGNPGGARAVGQALKSNKHPDETPCFKVVRSDGSVGGYTHPLGLREKIRRLEKDGIKVKNNRVNLSVYLHKF